MHQRRSRRSSIEAARRIGQIGIVVAACRRDRQAQARPGGVFHPGNTA